MRILLFLLGLTFLPAFAFAQPGGGGGLQIAGIYSEQLQPLDNKNFSCRLFFIDDTARYSPVIQEIYHPLDEGPRRGGKAQTLFLPPTPYELQKEKHRGTGSLRLLLALGTDTMLVDFLGVIGENAGGHVDVMDSLVFSPGYYRIFCSTYSFAGQDDFKTRIADDQRLNRGITPSNLEAFRHSYWLQQENNVRLSFIAKAEKEPRFLLHRADENARNKQFAAAAKDLQQVLAMKSSAADNEAACLLFSGVYSLQEKYDSALLYVNRAIALSPRIENYYVRLNIHTAARMYDAGVQDYAVIIGKAQSRQMAIQERAVYLMQYLHDYKWAKKDMQDILGQIPANHLKDRPGGWSEYSETYFLLGKAEYGNREYEKAFNHMLKAMLIGETVSSSDQLVLYFDTLIAKNSGSGALYLARAIAHQRRAPYLGWGDETKKAFRAALADIDLAEKKGLQDSRINYYRAFSLQQLKEPAKAFDEVEKAIAKNANDPLNYILRYNIRRDLGQTVWGKKDDPDLKRYDELLKNWTFEK